MQSRERARLTGSERDIQTESQSSARRATPQNSQKLIRLSKLARRNVTFTHRYLVPNDLTAYHFNYIIRKRIKLPEKDSLYFFVNGKYLLKGGTHLFSFLNPNILDTLMAQVYEKKKDSDGFLYITYTDETTLGAEFELLD